MMLKTADQWREAVVQRRIEMVRGASRDPILDKIVERLVALSYVADWMVLPPLDAAVEQWEGQNHNYRLEYDRITAQHARRDGEIYQRDEHLLDPF